MNILGELRKANWKTQRVFGKVVVGVSTKLKVLGQKKMGEGSVSGVER